MATNSNSNANVVSNPNPLLKPLLCSCGKSFYINAALIDHRRRFHDHFAQAVTRQATLAVPQVKSQVGHTQRAASNPTQKPAKKATKEPLPRVSGPSQQTRAARAAPKSTQSKNPSGTQAVTQVGPHTQQAQLQQERSLDVLVCELSLRNEEVGDGGEYVLTPGTADKISNISDTSTESESDGEWVRV